RHTRLQGDWSSDVCSSDLASFPAGLRQIDERYYLHDAHIGGIGRRGSSFVVILHLDTPPQSILTLTYDLVEDPVIIEDALPAQQIGRASCRESVWMTWGLL